MILYSEDTDVGVIDKENTEGGLYTCICIEILEWCGRENLLG